MAEGKPIKRNVSIFINGKQIAGSIKDLRSERRRLTREIEAGTKAEEEYNKAAKRIKEINGILTAHRNQLRTVESSWKKLTGVGINKFIALTAGAFAVESIVSYGAELFKLGAEMELVQQKAETVFGVALPLVTKEADANATAMGLTTSQYTKAATAIGDLLIPMKFQREEAAQISTELVNLSGALSEWTGGQISSIEVSRILSKALLGEREELKQLGISIQEADVKARLAEKGLEGLTGEMLQQAKAAATLELITEKSTDAQTAFANNSDILVRRQAELSAKLTEVTEKITTALLPVFERLVHVADNIASGILSFTKALTGLSDPAKAATQAFHEQQATIQGLETDLIPLVDRYEELHGNSKLNKEEQDELRQIIAQIGDIVPTAITQFDQYGRAMDISAEKTRGFVEATKLLARQENAERIDQNTKALNRYRQELGAINSQLGKRDDEGNLIRTVTEFSKTGSVSFRNIRLTADEIKNLQEQAAKLEVQIQNADNAIKLLSGEQLNVPTISAKGSDLATKAAEEEARKARAQAAADRLRTAERARQLIEDQLQQLKEAEERFREEARVNALSEDEQAIERIRQRYAKELQLAKELEGKGIQEGTSRRMELLRLQEEEMERFRSGQAEERLNRALQRTEAEEEALFQKQLELETAKQAAEQQIRDQLNQVLLNEQEQQLLQLEEQYAALTQLALQFGLDTTELTRAFEIQKDKLRENFAQKEVQRQENLKAIAIARAQAELSAFQELSSGLKELLSENEEASKGLFLFEKGLAAAEVIINLQKELASIAASNASLGPLAPAVIASLSTAAKVRSAIRLATIGATTIQGISQRKEGGYFNVTGKDDGRPYRARYIGTPASGMLPPYPVVLASEVGPEYFVSHKDLQNPKVLNHVRAIDNIRRQRLSQFVEGGSTAPLATAPPFSPSTGDTDLNGLALVAERLAVSVDTLNEILSSGIMAIIGDDTILQLRQREQKIVRASGGVL